MNHLALLAHIDLLVCVYAMYRFFFVILRLVNASVLRRQPEYRCVRQIRYRAAHGPVKSKPPPFRLDLAGHHLVDGLHDLVCVQFLIPDSVCVDVDFVHEAGSLFPVSRPHFEQVRAVRLDDGDRRELRWAVRKFTRHKRIWVFFSDDICHRIEHKIFNVDYPCSPPLNTSRAISGMRCLTSCVAWYIGIEAGVPYVSCNFPSSS